MSNSYFLVFPEEYQKHPGYRQSSFTSRGIYFDLLQWMNGCSERGVLLFNDRPLLREKIAGVIGGDQQVVLGAIEELIQCGLIAVRKDGALFSPVLIAQEKARQDAARRKREQRERDEEAEKIGKISAGHSPVTIGSQSGHSDNRYINSSLSLSHACAIWQEVYGYPPPIYAQEYFDSQKIENETLWRETLTDWKVNRYSVRGLTSIYRAYCEKLERAATKAAKNGNVIQHPSAPKSQILTATPLTTCPKCQVLKGLDQCECGGVNQQKAAM